MSTVKKKIKVLVWIVMFAVIASMLYYVSSIYMGLYGLNKSADSSPFNESGVNNEIVVQPPNWTGKEPVNILLMGVDARGLKKERYLDPTA